MKIITLCTFAIATLGSLQIVGYATGSRVIRGLGLATGIAPYPKVFCEADGFEPFAATFTINGTDEKGESLEIPLTAERYSQLQGPYQRRNVYGAALAYAPRLPEELREHIFKNILTDESPLPRELDLPPLSNPVIQINAREGEDTPVFQYQLN